MMMASSRQFNSPENTIAVRDFIPTALLSGLEVGIQAIWKPGKQMTSGDCSPLVSEFLTEPLRS